MTEYIKAGIATITLAVIVIVGYYVVAFSFVENIDFLLMVN